MSKSVVLSDDAYEALAEHKRSDESFSDVVKRLAPPPIRTFGDLEKYLEQLDGPLFSDMAALERVKRRKERMACPRPTAEEFEKDLEAMAADPHIQAEIKKIDQEFRKTELDGLPRE